MGNESEEGEETRKAMSRRKLLGLAAAAAAGLALTPLTEKAQAASGGPLLIGEHNVADPGDITRLDTWVDGGVPHHEVGGLSVQNYGNISADGDLPTAIVGNCPKGIGLRGESDSGHGVFARSVGAAAIKAHSDHGTGVLGVGGDGESKTATGVWGYSKEGIGVHAVSETGTALKVDGISNCYAKVNPPPVSAFSVFNDASWIAEKPPFAIVGQCPQGVGITGFSDTGWAVHGNSKYNAGVYGYSDNDTGVWGWSPMGRGVYAKSEKGTALKVDGKSFFDTKVDGGSGFHVMNTGEIDPTAIVGKAPLGNGVIGEGCCGVFGHSGEGTGVSARSEKGIALDVDGKGNFYAKVDGDVAFIVRNTGTTVTVPGEPKPKWPVAMLVECEDGCGLLGRGGTGVQGESTTGTGDGVYGSSTNGHGVKGVSDTGIGVEAISKGIALMVDGKSSFSTVGSGTIVAGKDSFDVYVEPGLVTDKSHISVTLTSKPVKRWKAVAVSFIERHPPENRFEVHLTSAVELNTTFTYFIVEP